MPREDDETATVVADGVGPPSGGRRKPRRRRVNYGVVTVVDASAAVFGTVADALRPGDVVLSINGASVGGSTFADACRAMADSPACPETGVVRCSLTVARANAVVGAPVGQVVVVQGPSSGRTPTTCTPVDGGPPDVAVAVPGPTIAPLPSIPFRVVGDGTISGEFSSVEWTALVRGLSDIPHRLFSGMALISVSQREALVAIRKSDKYGGILRRRGLEALEAKLAHESKRVATEMRRRAERHWSIERKAETEKDADRPDGEGDAPTTGVPLTDARRSALRCAARPARGCKCGSPSHDFVSDPSCPLYSDVRQYCEENSIDIRDANHVDIHATRKAPTTMRAKNAVEKAYIDRFVKLRSENSATREEAEFVLEMETIQASIMKKAVFAPPSLCTLILSAVASVMDRLGGGESTREVGRNMDPSSATSKLPPPKSDSDDSDDSDDDGLPLNLLIQCGSKRRASNIKLPSSKQPKQTESSEPKIIGKRAPHPYCLAEILQHVSLCHGHLFEGKSVCECMSSSTRPWDTSIFR